MIARFTRRISQELCGELGKGVCPCELMIARSTSVRIAVRGTGAAQARGSANRTVDDRSVLTNAVIDRGLASFARWPERSGNELDARLSEDLRGDGDSDVGRLPGL